MKVNPYLHFKGNCAEAIAFYENAFGIKAKNIVRFSDTMIRDDKQKPGQENYIQHACLSFGKENAMHGLMMSDWEDAEIGRNISISVALKTPEEAKLVFDKLKLGGVVETELAKQFWTECWGSLTDKFGIMWQITIV